MTTSVTIKNNGPGPVRLWTQTLNEKQEVVRVGCGQLEPEETFTAVCYPGQRFLIEEAP